MSLQEIESKINYLTQEYNTLKNLRSSTYHQLSNINCESDDDEMNSKINEVQSKLDDILSSLNRISNDFRSLASEIQSDIEKETDKNNYAKGSAINVDQKSRNYDLFDYRIRKSEDVVSQLRGLLSRCQSCITSVDNTIRSTQVDFSECRNLHTKYERSHNVSEHRQSTSYVRSTISTIGNVASSVVSTAGKVTGTILKTGLKLAFGVITSLISGIFKITGAFKMGCGGGVKPTKASASYKTPSLTRFPGTGSSPSSGGGNFGRSSKGVTIESRSPYDFKVIKPELPKKNTTLTKKSVMKDLFNDVDNISKNSPPTELPPARDRVEWLNNEYAKNSYYKNKPKGF